VLQATRRLAGLPLASRALVLGAAVVGLAGALWVGLYVAAGSGIAIVPRSVVTALRAAANVAVHELPGDVARARTMLIRRPGHRSTALDALEEEIRRYARGAKLTRRASSMAPLAKRPSTIS